MRDLWYSDNGDVVKWGALVHIARQRHLRNILQVVCYQSDKAPHLRVDGKSVPFPNEVLRHFRSCDQIIEFGSQTSLNIRLLKKTFPRHRQLRPQYFSEVCAAIKEFGTEPILVFLDPDTGLSRNHPSPEHIGPAELGSVFDCLKPNDVIALYQHRPHEANWIETFQNRFATALGMAPKEVQVATCNEIEADVAIYVAQKRQLETNP